MPQIAQETKRLRKRPQYHANQRYDKKTLLCPLFNPTWAFEVDASQLERFLAYIPSSSEQEGDKKDIRNKELVGCIADRRESRGKATSSALIAANYRFDVRHVPRIYHRYMTRIFKV